jgi:flagellar motility protein MotE (MotC chaperone)
MYPGLIREFLRIFRENGTGTPSGHSATMTQSDGVDGTAKTQAIAASQAHLALDNAPRKHEDASSSTHVPALPVALASDTRHPSILRNSKFEVTLEGVEYIQKSEADKSATLASSLKKQAQSTELELQKAGHNIKKLRAQLAEAEKHAQSKHGQLIQAESDMQHLRACLDECKDRIFKMQPVEHMTDSQIAEQYVTLCDAVSDWTDKQFGDLDDPLAAIDMAMQREEAADVFDRFLVSDGGLQIAMTYPTTSCIMLTAFVHLFLHCNILHSKIFFPGLRPAWNELVTFVENGMRNIQPTRGKTALKLLLSSD